MILDRLPGRRPRPAPESEETPDPNEPLLARFHRRKLEAREKARQLPAQAENREPPPIPLTDADMPPVEGLDFGSDFSGFLSPKVSDALRRAALRKLFHSPALNVVDGLDEYADDFTQFEPLGDLITADMKHQMVQALEREKEAAKQHLSEEDETDPTPLDASPFDVKEENNPETPQRSNHDAPDAGSDT